MTTRYVSPYARSTAVILLPLLALIVAGALLATRLDGGTGSIPAPPANLPALSPDGYAIPAAPTDGVLTIVILPGTFDQMAVGGPGYILPSVIELHVGDTVVIENRDTQPHFMLYALLQPGQTNTRTFDAPLSEVYSAGCSAAPRTTNDFTTLFVWER